MKIVFLETDTLGTDVDFSAFNSLGEVVLYNRSEPALNPERVHDADILVVNKIPIGKDLLQDAKNIKFIAASATGTNNIDFEYTNARGIKVANARNYSTDSVVQHTFALLFYLYEKLHFYDTFVKSGEYSKYPLFSCFVPYFNELSGKTFGIIGLGKIGTAVARIAAAFGCKVIYYSTSGNNNNPEFTRCEYDTLLKESDIISIHCPLNKNTFKLIDKRAISLMKKDAILLNLARGPVIDEDALATALIEKKIGAAGLDVLCNEPASADNPLLKIQDSTRLIITPHMAWGTIEARKRCLDEVYKNIEAFLNGTDRNIVTS